MQEEKRRKRRTGEPCRKREPLIKRIKIVFYEEKVVKKVRKHAEKLRYVEEEEKRNEEKRDIEKYI